MSSPRRTGQVIGALIALQFFCGLTLPFVLLRPLTTGVPGFLTSAPENDPQIRLAVFLSFLGAALTVAIAIAAWPLVSRLSPALALWFLVACLVSFSMDAVHNVTVLSMLSLSQRYAETGGADAGMLEAVGVWAASARRWAHFTQLLGFGGWIFLFYAILWRFALVPRVLAILGVAGILLQFAGVTLQGFLGRPLMTPLAMPLAPIQLAVALWLMVRGFPERHPPIPAAAN